jgi:glutathione S-transferase
LSVISGRRLRSERCFFRLTPNPTKVRLHLSEKREGGCAIPIEEVVVNLVAGERPTTADCTLAVELQFGRFRELHFLDEYEGLAARDTFYRGCPAATAVLVM